MKESCWQCYKLYFPTDESNKFKDGNKTFCTEHCYKKYQALYSSKCQLEGCEKTFLKSAGAYVHGKWFCSDEHAESDPETKQIIDMLAQGIDFYNEEGDSMPENELGGALIPPK